MRSRSFLASVLVAGTLLASLAIAAPAGAFVNWPGYLFDPSHTSLNGAATAITPANAGTIAPAWSQAFAPGGGFFASPVVYNGDVYIGGNDGWFYQLDEATGKVLHSRHLGKEFACTDTPSYAYGVVDTATVAPDPSRGGALTVYVTGGDGTGTDGTVTNGHDGIFLWALDATTLKPVWTTDPVPVDVQPGDVGWASPMVSNGTISVGIASACDAPLVSGGMSVRSQANGALISKYLTVPPGVLGGSIWSTPAISGSSTWLATGNPDPTAGAQQGDSFSIVRLDGNATTHSDIWTVVPDQTGKDNDFGASPTLFTGTVNGVAGTPMIGDCNKNGTFYALRSQQLSLGAPVWKYQLSIQDDLLCNASAIWDAGAHQLIAGSTQTPNGNPGSIQALSPDQNPASRVIWQSYLPCAVEGPPSEDGAGVLAVVTFNGDLPCSGTAVPSLYLFDAHATVPNGSGPPAPQLLKTIPLGRAAFSQPAFADGYLFVTTDGSMMAYRVPAPPTPPTGGGSPPPPPSGAPTVTRAQIKADLRRALVPRGRAARILALLKHRRYTFMFRAPTAGKVVIEWLALPRGARAAKATKPVIVASGSARFAKPGRVRITIRLTPAGRRMLKHAHSLRLTAKGIYTPKGGSSLTATRTLRLRR
jgi:hypothetical protein